MTTQNKTMATKTGQMTKKRTKTMQHTQRRKNGHRESEHDYNDLKRHTNNKDTQRIPNQIV